MFTDDAVSLCRGLIDRVSDHPMDRLEELLADDWQAAQTAAQNMLP